MKIWNRTIKSTIGHVVALLTVFAIAVVIVMIIWNAIIPSLTGWVAISYVQAAGLMILGRLLTGGGFHPFGIFMHSHLRQQQEHIRFREKLHRLSREERKEFIRRRMFGKEDEPAADDVTKGKEDRSKEV